MSRRTPFDEIERLFDRMGQQFEDASQQWEGLSPQTMMGSGSASIDVVDREEAFEVTVDLPGFEPQDVDLRVVDQTLSIDAERSSEHSVDEGEFVHHERSRESVSRRVRLPAPVEVDDVRATMENGVLSLTLPKTRPDDSGHAIDIE